MTMMSDLPDDLLEEILFRVPARSVKRLGSTSKRLNRFVKDKRFTTKHFDNAPKQFLNLMLKESRVCLIRTNLQRFSPVKIEADLCLTDPNYRLDQIKIWRTSDPIKIWRVFHCDGLLLCVTNAEKTRLVVWNPCTGQTRWINHHHKQNATYAYALGSYQDERFLSNICICYKILSCRVYGGKQEFEICEINFNSWRVLDITLDFSLVCLLQGVSLKGKTYWIARDEKVFGKFLLVSFDYTTERFERLCLPSWYPSRQNLSLSVREEKLSVLSQCDVTSKTEVWVTNKISETKTVSWSKVLAVDLDIDFDTRFGGSFLFDEEKKVLVCCDGLQYKRKSDCLVDKRKTMVYIVGEDNDVRQVMFEGSSTQLPFLLNYVPSLIQIYQGIRGKRKRGK